MSQETSARNAPSPRAVARLGPRRLTLAQVKKLPATCTVEDVAAAIGFSRTHAYELIRAGEFPVAVITVRGRYRVVTASLIKLLAAEQAS